MTTHVPCTIYNLTYNAQLYLTIYQWLAGLQWLIFAIKLALIILNKWMDWFKIKKYNGGLANLLKFSSIQIKVGLYNVVDIKLANRYINNLGFFKFINS